MFALCVGAQGAFSFKWIVKWSFIVWTSFFIYQFVLFFSNSDNIAFAHSPTGTAICGDVKSACCTETALCVKIVWCIVVCRERNCIITTNWNIICWQNLPCKHSCCSALHKPHLDIFVIGHRMRKVYICAACRGQDLSQKNTLLPFRHIFPKLRTTSFTLEICPWYISSD